MGVLPPELQLTVMGLLDAKSLLDVGKSSKRLLSVIQACTFTLPLSFDGLAKEVEIIVYSCSGKEHPVNYSVSHAADSTLLPLFFKDLDGSTLVSRQILHNPKNLVVSLAIPELLRGNAATYTGMGPTVDLQAAPNASTVSWNLCILLCS